jgi:hypothetical protein
LFQVRLLILPSSSPEAHIDPQAEMSPIPLSKTLATQPDWGLTGRALGNLRLGFAAKWWQGSSWSLPRFLFSITFAFLLFLFLRVYSLVRLLRTYIFGIIQQQLTDKTDKTYAQKMGDQPVVAEGLVW